MVTFGVAPAFALWTAYVDEAFNPHRKFATGFVMGDTPIIVMGCVAAILCIASAWRLAKFNTDTRQTHGFLGLATPANGLFWASTVLVAAGSGVTSLAVDQGLQFLYTGLMAQFPWITLGIAIVLSILMLSELPLPGLKFKHFKWKGNEVIFLLLGIGVVLVVLYGMLAVPLIMVLYILSPLWGRVFGKGV
jgi:CDP-diacylglycerol---serine O-phosphatidyltransferase